jgi:hypothetical protein
MKNWIRRIIGQPTDLTVPKYFGDQVQKRGGGGPILSGTPYSLPSVETNKTRTQIKDLYGIISNLVIHINNLEERVDKLEKERNSKIKSSGK